MSFFILSLQEMLFFNVELFKTRLMEIKTFIANYKAAFGENTELPIVFWYSDTLENQTEKINGCFFKDMRKVREGHTVSLNADVIGCGGGKFYTGFTDMPERVPTFVSLKEKYKETPEMVIEYIDRLGVTKQRIVICILHVWIKWILWILLKVSCFWQLPIYFRDW